jgi:hypothetical protein
MTADALLKECESIVVEGPSLLWRQIAPSWRRSEWPILEAFIPSSKDQRMLSVGQADKVSAEDYWHEYVFDFDLNSAGVVAVSVAEVYEALDLEDAEGRVVDDSECPTSPRWHGYIDFRFIEERGRRKAFAQHLWLAARQRGWVLGPMSTVAVTPPTS